MCILQNNGIADLVDVRLPQTEHIKAKSWDKGIEKWLFEFGISLLCALIELGNIFMECPDWPKQKCS